MIFDTFLNPVIFTSIAITLLHFLWQGLAVALILACLLKVIDNQHSRVRYACSSIAMLLNLLLPIITFFILQQPESGVLYKATGIQTNHLLGLTILPEKDSLNHTILSLLPHLTLIWSIAIAYLSIKLLYQMINVNQLPKRGVIAPDEVLYKRFNDLVSQLKINQRVSLLISVNIDVPMAVGWLKPVVLLPASMLTGLTAAQLEMLLLHELAHIKRYDYLANLLQSIVEIFLFFHPAVFWVSKQMRIEREYCSDDIAVKYCGDALAYAHTLTDTATLCHQHRHATPQMAMAASGGDLKQRVLRLVTQHHCLTSYDKSKWLAAISIVCIMFLFTSTQVRHLDNLGIKPNSTVLSSTVFIANNYQKLIPSISTPTKTSHEIPTKSQISTISLQYDLAVKIFTEIVSEEKKESDDDYINTARTQFIESAHSFSNTTEKTNQDKNRDTSDDTEALSSIILDELKKPDEYKDPIESFSYNNPKKITKKASIQKQLSSPIQKKVYQESKQSIDLEKYQAAKVLSIIQPKYPTKAQRKNIQMSLTVNFAIDALGNINNIQIENKSKAHYFKPAIKSALKKWKFLPAEQNGQPINSSMTKIFSFYLKN